MTRSKSIVAIFFIWIGLFLISCVRHHSDRLAVGASLYHPPPNLCLVLSGKKSCIAGESLLKNLAPVELAVEDPVYKKQKKYRGYWLEDLVKFIGPSEKEQHLELIALDGYKTEIGLNNSTYASKPLLAFEDLGAAETWESFLHGKELITPAPWYLVWGAHSNSQLRPWPYQVTELVFSSSGADYDKLSPSGKVRETSGVVRGFRLFVQHCIKCHSINLVGGAVGPELNYPRSVLSYWRVAELRKFIVSPSQIRARSKMPDFSATLSKYDIDDLVSYLEWASRDSKDLSAPELAVP